jgi:hypothetical protein
MQLSHSNLRKSGIELYYLAATNYIQIVPKFMYETAEPGKRHWIYNTGGEVS